MDQDRLFQAIASRLFQLLEVEGDPTEHASRGYTVTLNDRVQIELIGLQPGYLNLLSVIGTLPDKTDGHTLATMLFVNRFTFDHPQIILGIDPETARITLCTRQALSELDDKSSLALFDRFSRLAASIQKWLEAGGDQRTAMRPTEGKINTTTQLKIRRTNTSP